MKRTTYAILAGSLAFGLTAAAATGVAFTIGTVQNVPGTDYDTQIVATSSCTGTYNITWTINSSGSATAFLATRTAPDGEDTYGSFCKGVPAYISISRMGMNLSYASGTTDATTGNFTGTLSTSIVMEANDDVRLEIGPNAGFMP